MASGRNKYIEHFLLEEPDKSCLKETFFAPNLGDEGVFGLESDSDCLDSFGQFPSGLYSPSTTEETAVNTSPPTAQGKVDTPTRQQCTSPSSAEQPVDSAISEAYSDSPPCITPQQALSPLVNTSIDKGVSQVHATPQCTSVGGYCAQQNFVYSTGPPVSLVNTSVYSRQLCSEQNSWFPEYSCTLAPLLTGYNQQHSWSGQQCYYPAKRPCIRDPSYLASIREPSVFPPVQQQSAAAQQYYQNSYWNISPQFPAPCLDIPDITSDVGNAFSNGFSSAPAYDYKRTFQFPVSSSPAHLPLGYPQSPVYYHPPPQVHPYQQASLQPQQQQQAVGDFLAPIAPLANQRYFASQCVQPKRQRVGRMDSGSPMTNSDSMDSEDVMFAAMQTKTTSQKRGRGDGDKPTKGRKKASGKSPKKKKKKDPNEPQKPVSAYALFFRDAQAAIKSQNPGATFGEVSKIVASLWDNLDEDTKNDYKRRTEVAKKDCLQKLAVYRASLVSQGVLDPSAEVDVLALSSFSELDQRAPESLALSSGCGDLDLSVKMPADHSDTIVSEEEDPSRSSAPQLHSSTPVDVDSTDGTIASDKTSSKGSTITAESFYTKNVKSPTCARSGCTNEAVPSPKWNDDYCSSECVVEHCRDVFNGWVSSNPSGIAN